MLRQYVRHRSGLYLPDEKPPFGSIIDSEHPLARGLVGCWLMNEGAGSSAWNLASQAPGAITGATWNRGGLDFDGAADYVTVGDIDLPYVGKPFSFATRVILDSVSGTRTIATDNAKVFIRITAAGPEIIVLGLTPDRLTLVSPYVLSAGVWYSLVFNYTGAAYEIYVDGVQWGTRAITSGSYTNSTNNFLIGSRGGTSEHLDGAIEYLHYFGGRSLTASEIQGLPADPYQMIYRPPWAFFIDMGAGGTTRNLLASIQGATTTPDITSIIARAIIAGVAATSVTTEASASMLRNLLASISGTSSVPDAAANLNRSLTASISGASSTQDAIAATARALLASIVGQSASTDLSAITARSILSNIQGASSTPSIAVVVARAIQASIEGQSLTTDASASIIRSLLAAVSGQSVTTDVTATIQGVISLIASIQGQSTTTDVVATMARLIAAGIAGQSVTADATASIARSLAAQIAGASSTPDITATLTNIISLVASVQGISVTSDTAASIARTLSAAIAGESITPDTQATVARMLLADIAGTSVTPDDLVALLGGLGVIIDPTIVSLTPKRTMASLTPKRTIVSL